MDEIKLPSGAILKVTLSPFIESKALYQALLEEAVNLKLDPDAEMDINFYKNLFCTGFASQKIEKALWVCMKRATYNNFKMDENTFEPESAREDYFQVCFEVARRNVTPFTKNLYAQLRQNIDQLKSVGPA